MKKHISDSEILNWNDRLINTPYVLFPRYHTHSSYPMILVKQRVKGSFHYEEEIITLDPHMKFNFSFSVSKNRVDTFFHIFNKWFTNEIMTKTIFIDKDNREKVGDIEISDSIIKSKIETEHKVLEKEYTRFTYHFEGRLSSIMAYVMFLEDSIDMLSLIWGYDENGGEHLLTKFTIGSIVSKVDNKSEDYLVTDYNFSKSGNNSFEIGYEVSKMIQKGQVIQYGNSEILREDKITWSRNNRIDDILN